MIGDFYDTSIFHLPRQNPYFCLKWLKIKALWEVESDLYPCYTPLFYVKEKILTGLPSIRRKIKKENLSVIYDGDLLEKEYE